MLFPSLRIDCCSFAKSLPTLCDTMDCKMPGFSVGFPRQDYRSRLPFPYPESLLDPGNEPASLAWQKNLLFLSYQGSPKNQ